MLDPKIEAAISALIKRLDEREHELQRDGWSEEDDNIIRMYWRKRTTYYVAGRLRRSRAAVRSRAVALNLEPGRKRNAA